MRNANLLGATLFYALQGTGMFVARPRTATARPTGNDRPRNPLRGYYGRYSHVLTEYLTTAVRPTRNQRKRANRATR